MSATSEIEQRWNEGYIFGWKEGKSGQPLPPPLIPSFTYVIPEGEIDPGQYAFDKGYLEGRTAREFLGSGAVGPTNW